MPDYIALYRAYLEQEKHASPNTVSSYVRDLTQFRVWLPQGSDLRRVKPAAVEEYLAHLTDQGRSAATVTRSAASIKSFYHYLVLSGAMKASPAKGVAAAKVERKCPEILTGREVELFLEQPKCVDEKGYRDHAMLELMYATGVRVSELIALNVEDVNLPAAFLRCGDEKRERIIPLYPRAVKALRDYIQVIRPRLADQEEAALFVNMNGQRMTRQGFWKLVKHYQAKAEITKDITPTPCDTPLRCICWRTGRTCAPSRRCWATRTSPPHRSTPTSSSSTCRTCTARRTPWPDRIEPQRSKKTAALCCISPEHLL